MLDILTLVNEKSKNFLQWLTFSLTEDREYDSGGRSQAKKNPPPWQVGGGSIPVENRTKTPGGTRVRKEPKQPLVGLLRNVGDWVSCRFIEPGN